MAPPNITDARITGPALVVLLYFPKHFQKLLPPKLRPIVKSPLLLKLLIALLGVDVLRKSNRALSRYITHNGTRVTFRPSSELILITGGSSGLGLLMAKEFAKRGVKVVIQDLNPPKESIPANVHFYKCDVRSVSEISESAAEVRKNHGDPTVLINNAGIGNLLPILECTEQSVKNTFGVNTMSHFWMAREYVPAMVKKNHGHVVTIASLSSYVSHALMVDYSCTKASALAFHEGLSSELANLYNAPNIRLTTVNPAWIRTPLTEALLENPKFRPSYMEPDFVIQKVVDQVMNAEGGYIIIPKKLYILATIRSWPTWLQTHVRNVLGKGMKSVMDAMETRKCLDTT